MSRLWPDRLLISLAAGEVCWLRLTGARGRTLLAKRTVAADAAYGAEPWQGAVAALRAESQAWSRDALAVSIVLSNHFVRYALVPPGSGVSGAEEELALARYHFTRLYGDQCGNWEIRLAASGASGATPACAIDSGLLQSLRECFPPTSRPRLASVQPLLMSAFNCWRGELPKTGAWLLLVEPERACLALNSGRHWVAVHNARGQFQDVEAWAALLDRERWRVELERVPETVLVHAPGAAPGSLAPRGGWTWSGLKAAWPAGLSPLQDSAYANALTAA